MLSVIPPLEKRGAMYHKHVTTTYESPFGTTFELPTLAQIVSVCINSEDRFYIEQDNTSYEFFNDDYDYWTIEKLAKALREHWFNGNERVYSMSLALDYDEPYYIIHIQTENDR